MSNLLRVLIIMMIVFVKTLPQELEKINFPGIEGFEKSNEVSEYTPYDLYDYINGAADAFLSYNFQELFVQVYENDSGQSIKAEIYVHADDNNAYGIYTAERPLESNFLDIGIQAYYEKGMLNFVRGLFYIKINGYYLNEKDEEILINTAEKINHILDGSQQYPEIFNYFPTNSRVKNSERYININFLGYSFLNSAFTIDYLNENKRIKMFLLTAENQDKSLRMILDLFKNNDRTEMPVPGVIYEVNDKYQGTIILEWRGNYVWGCMTDESSDFVLNSFETLKNNLFKESKKETTSISLENISWIAGSWQGELFEGIGEEIWSRPSSGTMIGMFKHIRNDKVTFYEFMTINEKEEGIVLRIKHFNADMTAWEEKSETVDFKLKKVTDSEILFDGYSFQKLNNNTMRCSLIVENDSNKIETVTWLFSRMN